MPYSGRLLQLCSNHPLSQVFTEFVQLWAWGASLCRHFLHHLFTRLPSDTAKLFPSSSSSHNMYHNFLVFGWMCSLLGWVFNFGGRFASAYRYSLLPYSHGFTAKPATCHSPCLDKKALLEPSRGQLPLYGGISPPQVRGDLPGAAYLRSPLILP